MQGSAKVNDTVKAMNLEGDTIETGRLTKLLKFEGTERVHGVEEELPSEALDVRPLPGTPCRAPQQDPLAMMSLADWPMSLRRQLKEAQRLSRELQAEGVQMMVGIDPSSL